MRPAPGSAAQYRKALEFMPYNRAIREKLRVLGDETNAPDDLFDLGPLDPFVAKVLDKYAQQRK